MGDELLMNQRTLPSPVLDESSTTVKELPGTIFCQEGLQCSQEETLAEYFCHECKSYQCSQCESFLHSTKELKQHKRKKIHSTDISVCKLWCKPKNVVTLFCQQCNMEMCGECDSKMHQGGRKNHTRVTAGSSAALSRDDEVKLKGQLKEIASGSPIQSFLLVNNNEELLVRF